MESRKIESLVKHARRVISICALTVPTAIAADLKDVKVGDVYYLWRITEPLKVKVAEIDGSGSQVRVSYPSGELVWVAAARLERRPNPTDRDMGIVAALLRSAICSLRRCRYDDLANTQPQPSAPAASAATATPPTTEPATEQASAPKYSPGCYIGIAADNLEYFMFRGEKFEYGVQIRSVQPGMPASLAKLQNGDVVWEIDGKNVLSMEFLKSHMNSLPTCGTHLFKIIREQQVMQATIPAVMK